MNYEQGILNIVFVYCAGCFLDQVIKLHAQWNGH